MKRIYLVAFLIILVIFSACSKNDEEQSLELTEEEKTIVNIEREQSHLEEVYELTNSLTPEDTVTLEDESTIEVYAPEEFTRFILPEGWVTEVTRASKLDDKGDTLDNIAVNYTYKSHSIIIDYFSNGFIRKSILNNKTGYVLVNENNEEYFKYHFEDLAQEE